MKETKDRQIYKAKLIGELEEARSRIAELEKLEYRRETEGRELKRLNRALEALGECSQAVVRAAGEEELLNEACRIMVETGGYCRAWIGLVRKGNGEAVMPVAWAGSRTDYFREAAAGDREMKYDHTLTGKVISSGSYAVAKTVPLDNTAAPCCDDAAGKGYISMISLPLMADGAAFGALNIHAVEPETFNEQEIGLLKKLTDNLSFGIIALRTRAARDRAVQAFKESEERYRKSEGELKTSLKKLRETMKKTITAMAKVSEVRDPYTAGHQQQVAELSCAIAGELDMPREKIDYIQLAASVHDIGKIHVPSELLTMPGHISKLEFELIKTHPRAGYEILKTMDFPWPIAEIVLQHHEKINGSGYPDGLSGDQIVPEARILCVADVVEAMSSHRPYRPTLGVEVALEEISRESGTLYDPEIVDACLRLFAEAKFSFS